MNTQPRDLAAEVEEIRKRSYCGTTGDGVKVHCRLSADEGDLLFAHIAALTRELEELRRPLAELKKEAESEEGMEPQRMMQYLCRRVDALQKATRRLQPDNERLRAENEQHKAWAEEWHKALETAAVVVEAQSNGSPSEVVESIRARFDLLQAELARLSSPPEERGEIVERQPALRYVLMSGNWSDACYLIQQAIADIDTLLQDLRRYENSHKILMAERDEARGKVKQLEIELGRGHAQDTATDDHRADRV